MVGNSDVVITGMGLASPLGCDPDLFWRRLVAGESGVDTIRRFDASDLPVRFAGEVDDWDQISQADFDSKDRKRLDRFCQFAIYAARRAVEQANLDLTQLNLDRCGVAMGSAIGGLEELEDQHQRLLEGGPRKVSPYTIPKMLANSAAGLISIEYGFRGPATCVTTACASANQSIADALRMIRAGMVDLMIVGGTEAAVVPIAISGFARMQALSTRNDNPQAASRPWDRQRDGFVMGEGAAALVIESAEHAQRHHRIPIARLMGGGLSSDGYHITSPREDGGGAATAMQLAIRDAGLEAKDIEYINAHGTSTPMGDQAETRAIRLVFGEHADRLAISSTKSQIGHLLGASGAVELIACIGAIRHQTIPPTINLDQVDQGCDLDYVPHHARPAKLNHILSNSFGFGGHNASIVIGSV